eukprot:1158467-Pelagomonas_calceolata.AAC.2
MPHHLAHCAHVENPAWAGRVVRLVHGLTFQKCSFFLILAMHALDCMDGRQLLNQLHDKLHGARFIWYAKKKKAASRG